MPSNLKELLEWVPEIDDLAAATRAAARHHENSADFYNGLTNTSTWEGSSGEAARASLAMTAAQHDEAAQNLTLGALGMAHAQHQAEILANKIRGLDGYAHEPPAVEVDLETNKVSLPASYDYLDEEAQANVDTKMTVLEEQIVRLLAEGQRIDTELSHAIAAASGLPEPEANHGDPGSSTSDPPLDPSKRVPGPDGNPPYDYHGDPFDPKAQPTMIPGAEVVPLADNPPGFPPAAAGTTRDENWKQYLDGLNPDGSRRVPVGTMPDALPKPEAVQDPKLRAIGAAGRQQGVSYAWGGNNSLHGPTKGTLEGDPPGGDAHTYHDDQRVGFDCGGLVRFSEYQATGHDVFERRDGANAGAGTDRIDGSAWTAPVEGGNRIPPGQVASVAQPGDILVFETTGSGHEAYSGWNTEHTGIYVGNGIMINAHQSGEPIRLDIVNRDGRMTDVLRPKP